MKSNNTGKNFAQDENAVSPVIGVILMVAVTVILAAVIAAFLFGFAGNMPQAPNVAYFTVERTGTAQVTITNNCPLIADLTNVHVFVGDTSIPTNEITATTLGTTDLSEYNAKIVIDGGAVATAQPTASPTPINAKSPLIKSDPMVITITAQVNGAPLQVVQTITV